MREALNRLRTLSRAPAFAVLVAVACCTPFVSSQETPRWWRLSLSQRGVYAGIEQVAVAVDGEFETTTIRQVVTTTSWDPWFWTPARSVSRVDATIRRKAGALVGIEQERRWLDRVRRTKVRREGSNLVADVDGHVAQCAVPENATLLVFGFYSEWLRRTDGVDAVAVFEPEAGVVLAQGALRREDADESSEPWIDARFIAGASEIAARSARFEFPEWWVDTWSADDGSAVVHDSRFGTIAERHSALGPRFERHPEGVVESRIAVGRGHADPLTDLRSSLDGCVCRPRQATPCGAVILLSGSGPDDADAHVAGHAFLDRIAWDLAAAGIASLRWSDRSLGRSGGDFEAIRVRDLVDDAAAALAELRRQVPGVPVAAIGHSEGALVAALLASGERGADLRAVALLGCPSTPLDLIIMEQQGSLSDVSASMATAARERWAEIFGLIRESSAEVLTIDGAPRHVGWLRDHLALDPSKLVARIPCRVELFQGLGDRQVLPWHAGRLEAALGSGKTSGFAVHRLDELDHSFMPAATSDHPGGPDRALDPAFRKLLVARLLAAFEK